MTIAESLASETNQTGTKILRVGNLRIELADKRAFVGDEQVCLTGKEFKVLLALMLYALTRVYVRMQTLTAEVFGNHDERSAVGIRVHLCRVREKLDDYGSTVGISCNKTYGYFFFDTKDNSKPEVTAE